MTEPWLQLLLFLGTLLMIGLLEGTEISLLSADRFRLRGMAKVHRPGAELSLDLLQRRSQILSTILVLGTLVSTTAAALATSLIEDFLGATALAAVVTTLGVTLVVLLFGQVLPKSLARQRAEQVLATASRPLLALDLLLLPVTLPIQGVLHLLQRISGSTGRERGVLSREELKLLMQDVQAETGTLRQERRMLQSILDFGSTTAREVMVPMPRVVSLERETSLDMFRAVIRRSGFTRIPIFDRRVDQVVGVANAFDILLDPQAGETVGDYQRPITLVPETKRIDRLMLEMQRRGESMVVVVNEFGSCTGIVTMEDIVEEIMGEFADEHEVGVKRIRSLEEGVYMVDALTDIDDLNEELGLDLPKLRYDTIGGLVMRRLGRIPREGDRLDAFGVDMEVVEVYPYGVRTVKIALPDPRSEGALESR